MSSGVVVTAMRSVAIVRADGTKEEFGDRMEVVTRVGFGHLEVTYEPPLPPLQNGDTLVINGVPAWVQEEL